MTYSIDLYCNDGSPLGLIPSDIYGRGVGGAELSMMTWAETMAGRGHKVRIFNNPNSPGIYNGVEYLPQGAFLPRELRDVFICYRSPNPYTRISNAHVKLFWSTDQYTSGDFARDIFPFVDRTICISPFHVAYHRERYDADKIGYFDLGVRLEDYEVETEKVPGRCIFCSVPERGLDIMRVIWPLIKEMRPDASLVITSDYTLWGAPNPLNQRYRLDFLHIPDVEFMGAIPRKQLAIEQLKAQIQSYPVTYNELFCISAAECQVAGTTPVTSSMGALPTTNKWGYILKGNLMEGDWQRQFAEAVCARMETSTNGMVKEARQRFDWQRICKQWEYLIETGEYE